MLIKQEELLEEINKNKDVIIVDVRSFPNYVKEHIPKAYWFYVFDLTKYKEGQPSTLKDVNTLCEVLASKGFDHEKETRIYCDMNSLTQASFLFFVLEYLGYDKAKILEGGFEKWKSKNYPIEKGINKPKQGKFVAKINQEIKVNYNYVLEKLENKDSVIIDTRSIEEYYSKIGSMKGRIPKSINIPHINLVQEFPYSFKLELLKEKIENLNKYKEIILYCSSGDRATYFYFVLSKILNFKNVKVYLESFYEWHNLNLPIEI